MASQLLQTLVTNQLTSFALKHTLDQLVVLAETKVPGKTKQQKIDWCTQELLAALEKYDNRIPVIGKLLDIPISDKMEAWAIHHAIDAAYAKYEIFQTAHEAALKV